MFNYSKGERRGCNIKTYNKIMETKHHAKRVTYRIPYTISNQDSKRHSGGVNRLIRNSTDQLFSAGRDSTIRQWRLEKDRDIMVVPNNKSNLTI